MILFQKYLRRNIKCKTWEDSGKACSGILWLALHTYFKKVVSKEDCHDSGLAVPKRTDDYPVEVVKMLSLP